MIQHKVGITIIYLNSVYKTREKNKKTLTLQKKAVYGWHHAGSIEIKHRSSTWECHVKSKITFLELVDLIFLRVFATIIFSSLIDDSTLGQIESAKTKMLNIFTECEYVTMHLLQLKKRSLLYAKKLFNLWYLRWCKRVCEPHTS